MRTPALALVAFLCLASPALAAPPVPSYTVTPNPPVEGVAASFTNTSTDPNSDPIVKVEWDWVFDPTDNTYDVTQTDFSSPVSHSYPSDGSFTLRMRVTDAADEVRVESFAITVEPNAAPVAQFGFSPLSPVVGEPVTFQSFSIDPDGSIASQAWDVGNDGSVEGTDPSFSTSNLTQGTHTIALTVTDNDGATDKETHTVTVGAAPVPVNKKPVAQFGFSPLTPLVGETVTFQSFSIDPDGSIASQAWDVGGDGSVEGTEPTFSTSSLTQGANTVVLTVTDNNGDTDTETQTVTVGPAPAPPGTATTTTTTTTTPGTTPPPTTIVEPAQPSLMSPFPIVRIAGTVLARGARVRTLEVRTSIGSRITVRCVGRSCPFARASRVATTRLVRFRGMRGFLRAGVILSISVRKTGQIGKYTRFVIRAGRVPKRTDRCLMPGRSTPSACPES